MGELAQAKPGRAGIMKRMILLAIVLVGFAAANAMAQAPASSPDSLAVAAPDSAAVGADTTIWDDSYDGDVLRPDHQETGILRYLVPVLVTVAAGVATWLLFTVRSS